MVNNPIAKGRGEDFPQNRFFYSKTNGAIRRVGMAPQLLLKFQEFGFKLSRVVSASFVFPAVDVCLVEVLEIE